mmetsp:Transcript_7544/g.16413  ORF Transcript_7544/g.16413 Transcript_7544/m.16413 type:complete len:91 (+) Transcript_7544:274-546(+)
MIRRKKLQGARCFEYEPGEDGGFRISVPSHALTIATDVEQWKAQVEEGGYPEGSVVFVRVIGICALATVEMGDGDKTKLRMVKKKEVDEF